MPRVRYREQKYLEPNARLAQLPPTPPHPPSYRLPSSFSPHPASMTPSQPPVLHLPLKLPLTNQIPRHELGPRTVIVARIVARDDDLLPRGVFRDAHVVGMVAGVLSCFRRCQSGWHSCVFLLLRGMERGGVSKRSHIQATSNTNPKRSTGSARPSWLLLPPTTASTRGPG